MTSRRPAAASNAQAPPPECAARLEQVFAWLDGELAGSEADAVARHVATCPFCGSLAEDLRRAIAACRAAGDCRVPRAVHRRAHARAQALIKGTRRRR